MTKFALTAFAVSFLVISGCKQEQPPEEVKTVEWYKANKSERDTRLAKCQSNPGELALTPNCVNANRAKQSLTWGATGGGISPVEPITANDIKKK
ncbi:MAG: hypothetical protein EOO38_22695 [Cytophagaceae bacterium]|nr:MAG: hypothetical protein EOO38_22695 [Cytophagaceae bacterium]